MGNVFDNNLPRSNLQDFMSRFSYKGYSREDLDRRGSQTNKFSSSEIRTPERIKGASLARNLGPQRFDRYDSINSQNNWYKDYKASLKKTYNGNYHENFGRDDASQRGNPYTTDTDISRYNTHRPDNIHYQATPLSRNELSSSASEVREDNLGELIRDFDSEINNLSAEGVFQKVDAALDLAERLEKSKASKDTQIENLENLITIFDLMDKLIESDISDLQALRNSDKANRGENTGLQTKKELKAVNGMMTRTSAKAELNSKRQELNQNLVIKKVFS